MKLSVIVSCSEIDVGTGEYRVPFLEHCLRQMNPAAHGHDDFEVLVVSDGPSPVIAGVVDGHDERFAYHHVPPGGISGGGRQRNLGMEEATGDLLIFIDDDDHYVPGAFARIADLADRHPGRLLIWCMQRRSGRVLWTDDPASSGHAGVAERGHVGTPMMGVPNLPDRLGAWGQSRLSDAHFLESTLARGWPEIVWSREVMAKVRATHDRRPWPGMILAHSDAVAAG